MRLVTRLSLARIKAASGAVRIIHGKRVHQTFLERCSEVILSEMGIGGKGSVMDSGEMGALDLVPNARGAVVFDVGANVGDFCRAVLERKPLAAVHCFEPSLATFATLKDLLDGECRVVLNQIALGSSVGRQILYADERRSGMASLHRRRLDHFGIEFKIEEQVAIDTIDNYCAQKCISSIDLLKIDVEGHELSVLRGGELLFGRRGVKAALFEFGGTQIDSRTFVQDFYYFFKFHGMRLNRVTPTGYLHPIQSYRELYEQFAYTNFVATLQ
jgi:FkbM family methyltransferase